MNPSKHSFLCRPCGRTLALAAMLAASSMPAPARAAEAPSSYAPTWQSLERHETPEWFRDAKFGIYTHWGPVTVGAEDGPAGVQWYGRNMYLTNSPTFAYHRRKFGDQHSFGYKDIIPLFKAEKFDAETWAELFAASGARFAGPVAIHHDNFAMWDSALTEWDCQDRGPHRDITGELVRALRRHGLKYVAAFHHAFTWEYYEPSYRYDGADPRYAGLYCEPHPHGAPPSKAFLRQWLGKVNEVVKKYEPDLLWFDFGLGKLIPEAWQRRMFADYYNWAAAHGRQVGVAHKHREIHQHTGILDFERGREATVTPYPWLTDTSIGPWFHQKSAGFKSVNQLVDVLVDIVAKNGCLLLNVGPRADGSIPPQGVKLLRGIGRWLQVNGEAIYATRPWEVYGEGPTRQAKSGGFSEQSDKEFTSRDLRFTRSKDGRFFYLITLGWPEEPFTVHNLAARPGDQARIELLGHRGKVRFQVDAEDRLILEPPALPADRRPCQHAFVFKLTGFALELHPDARFSMPGAVTLSPAAATIEGSHICLQDKGGRPNLGCWDDAREKLHWLTWAPVSGPHVLRAELSSAGGPSALRVRLAGSSTTVAVPKTDGWFKPKFVNLGVFDLPKSGVHQLTLEPADPRAWKAVNVWQVQIAPAGPAPGSQSRR